MSTNKEKFLELCKRAKRLSDEGDDESIRKSLEIYVEALTFNPTNEKLIRKIEKIKAYLIQANEDDEEDEDSNYQNKSTNNNISIIKNNKYKRRNDDDESGENDDNESGENDNDDMEQIGSMTHMGDGFYLASTVYRRLYNYQRDGVKYLYGLFQQQKGGILGDDMGLGKTVQVCSFLSGMFDSKRIKFVIIVLPPPLILNWIAELKKWTPNLRVEKYHDASIKDRAKILLAIQQNHGILLTTYNMVCTSFDKLSDYKGRTFVWDHCILDEGHKIKNPSAKTTKAVHSINARNRIILSGTPIMNNLKEFWSLYDWTHKGQLLGKMKTFHESYEKPILRSREKDASQSEQKFGEMMARSLQSLIGPFLLRRSKKQVVASQRLEAINGLVGDSPRMPDLGVKSDLICWLRLSEAQLMVYKEFLTSDEVKNLLINTTKSPLVELTVLKKICDHPRLLSNQKCRLLGVTQVQDDLEENEDDNTDFDVSIIPEHVLINECGKMAFLVQLLSRLKEQGHRTLVFSQSRRILDIVQKIMLDRGNKMLRIDGRIKSFQERQTIIDQFQSDPSIDVLLLTSRVGGVGLNLTAANRVVIYDPSWNPSVDSQAIDRAFRIGQERDVVVYRLITCGTVEEKIYRRQIYKDSVTKKVLKESKNPMRHFTREEIRSLFELGNIKESETSKQINLQFEGDKQAARDASQDVQSNIAFLTKIDHCNGVSEHDLVFCRDDEDEDGEETDDISKQYLDKRMTDAFQLLNLESEENRMMVETTGRYAGGGELKKKVPSSSRFPSSSTQPKFTLPAFSQQNRFLSQSSAFFNQEEEDEEKTTFTKSPLRPPPLHTSTPRAIVIDDEDGDDDGEVRNENKRMEYDDDKDDTKKCTVGSDDDYEDDEVFTKKYTNNVTLDREVRNKDNSIEDSTHKSSTTKTTNPLTNLHVDIISAVCKNNETSVNNPIHADELSFTLANVPNGSDLFPDNSDDGNDEGDKDGPGDDDVAIVKDDDYDCSGNDVTKDGEDNVKIGDGIQSFEENVISQIKNGDEEDHDDKDIDDNKEEKLIENTVNAKFKTHLFDKFLHLSSQNVSKIDDVAKDGSVQVDSEDDIKNDGVDGKNDGVDGKKAADLVVDETDDEETDEKMKGSGEEVVAETDEDEIRSVDDDDETNYDVDDSIDSNVVSRRNNNLAEGSVSLNEFSNRRRSIKDINCSNDSCHDSNINHSVLKDSSTNASVGNGSLSINHIRPNASASNSVDNKSSRDASMKSCLVVPRESTCSDNNDSIINKHVKGKLIFSSDEEENDDETGDYNESDDETGDYNESDDEDEDKNTNKLKKELNSDVDDYEDSFIDDDLDDEDDD